MFSMRSSRLVLLSLSVFASAMLFTPAAMPQAAAPAVRIVNPIDESQLVTLKGTVHPLANARNDRGAAPDSLQLGRMHLVLTRSASQETALQQLIGEMHTPGTPATTSGLRRISSGSSSALRIRTSRRWRPG